VFKNKQVLAGILAEILMAIIISAIFCGQVWAKGESRGRIMEGIELERKVGSVDVHHFSPKLKKHFIMHATFGDDIEVDHFNAPKDVTLMNGYILKPKGKGPFPAIIYNHGG